jgi:SPP1 gp7 family putative phage head morphogenesis protein
LPQLLTKRRAAKSKPGVKLKGSKLRYNAAIQERYTRQLDRLIGRMVTETNAAVATLFDSDTAHNYFDYAEDASVASQARIVTNKLNKRFAELFNAQAKMLAESMVKATDKDSSKTLHASLKELSGGLSLRTSIIDNPLRNVITASVAENVALIKSIPSQYMLDVQGAVMRSITTGNGLKDLIPHLDKYADETKNRAKNIALDQTRKVYNNMNRDRMKALGVKRYEWIHSGGSVTPRPLHQSYNGRIFSFDDPPVIDEKTGEKGIPGQAINCRCTMRPVIEISEGEEYANV